MNTAAKRIGNGNDMWEELTIWQQNLNKSQTGQHDLISSRKLTNAGIDLIVLQEPSINFLGKTVASQDWIPIYPTTHEKEQRKTRAITLVSGKIPTKNWEQIDFHSGVVVVVLITGNWGQLILFNIYNDCTHNHTLQMLTKSHRDHSGMLTGREAETEKHHIIWLSDFNRHHPLWDSPDNHRLFIKEALDTAEMLIKQQQTTEWKWPSHRRYQHTSTT